MAASPPVDADGSSPSSSPLPSSSPSPSPRRRLLGLCLVAVAPWTLLVWDGGVDAVFAFGIVNRAAPYLVTLPEYLFRLAGGPGGLPARLAAWPTSVAVFGLAVASAVGGVALGREDRRVTGALVVLSALNQVVFAAGLTRDGLLAVPVGAVLAGAVAWWGYGDPLRRAAGLGSRPTADREE